MTTVERLANITMTITLYYTILYCINIYYIILYVAYLARQYCIVRIYKLQLLQCLMI